MSEDKFTLDSGNGDGNNQAPDAQETTDLTATKAESSEEVTTSPTTSSDSTQPSPNKKKSKVSIYTIIRIFCLIGFLVFTGLFINDVVIQPYRIKKSIEFTRDLYTKPTDAPIAIVAPTEPPITEVVQATPTPDPNKDDQGRLLTFKKLLDTNNDVKGWIDIPDTNINYLVVQSSKKDDPDYYLDKDINLDYSKAGTLYLDPRSSLETDTQNLVIHGHNMVSTQEKMFHFLLKYKTVSYYSEHPLISFDTIYDTGKWKVFAAFITNGSSKKEPLFEYRQSTFKDSSEFLNFVYQLRNRSFIDVSSVDVNENDQLLTLSTCSYEIDNYRFVVVARKVRPGEDLTVDVTKVTKNDHPLFPDSYFSHYGGEAPVLAATFEEALANGDIDWYIPPTDQVAK